MKGCGSLLFDKNQKTFPTRGHEAVWRLGTRVLPLDVTLDGEVIKQISPDLAESCKHLHSYVTHLLGDMYDNAELYSITHIHVPMTYLTLFMELSPSGRIDDRGLSLDAGEWVKFKGTFGKRIVFKEDKKNKISVDDRIRLLERCGIEIRRDGDTVIFSNPLYPGMFPAAQQLAQVCLDRKEKKSCDNSFTYCDFRRLHKKHKYNIYEDMLRILNDESRRIADSLELFARENGLRRSAGTYSHKGQPAFHIVCGWCDRTGVATDIAVKIETSFKPLDANDLFFTSLTGEARKYLLRNIKRCRMCNPKCGGNSIWIFGLLNRVCCGKVMFLKKPEEDEMPLVEELIKARMASIDEH